MHKGGSFPQIRLRRNRKSPWSRRLVAEHRLTVSDLILPLFVQEGKNKATPIKHMSGHARLSIDRLVKEVKKAAALGIPAVAIFPVVDAALKNDSGKEAFNKNNLICRAVHAVKELGLDIGIICDVALDPYTSHGHDGLVIGGDVANDPTVEALCKQAVVQARAGCDIIAPSDMMDGRVGAIRRALDDEGFINVQILSYAAKYASGFYGPFREAVGSAASLGMRDKRTYQMDPANSDEAIREVALDIREGADMIMIKPGMAYLDIIRRIKDTFNIPTFAYQVSGEYAMIKAAAERGIVDADSVMLETLLAFKRAGATGIFTYAAMDMAELLEKQN